MWSLYFWLLKADKQKQRSSTELNRCIRTQDFVFILSSFILNTAESMYIHNTQEDNNDNLKCKLS